MPISESSPLWDTISQHISLVSKEKFVPNSSIAIRGGCINFTIRLTDGSRNFFIKINEARLLEMFAAEAEGLTELAKTCTFRVPDPICYGTSLGKAYLVMEYVNFGHANQDSAQEAGHLLAILHQTQAKNFGWQHNNYLGTTRQFNSWHTNWVEFWRTQRLSFQLKLAAQNGYGGRLQTRGEQLLELFPNLLSHAPKPSLLHGDLWRGNFSYDENGKPLIFDPAVYYGDRETDLAMTELFGGFSTEFYSAYRDIWPLDSGYPVRKTFYNLYHILNHLNLFGGGYLGQARGMIDRLLAELGH
jgi:fructosamine-3-kinase